MTTTKHTPPRRNLPAPLPPNRRRVTGVSDLSSARDARKAGDDTDVLLYERRTERLVGAKQGCERLAEVIRMVTCAYGVWALWMPDEASDAYDKRVAPRSLSHRSPGIITTRMMIEMRDIAARLAPAGQIPLVIGDPLHRTLWISSRPLAMVLHRGRVGTRTLETVRAVSLLSGDAHGREDEPAAQITRLCGPAGRVLVAQSNAVVALAPRVACCEPDDLAFRWVLAAPQGIYRMRGAHLLTSWAERLLCLAVNPMGSAQGE